MNSPSHLHQLQHPHQNQQQFQQHSPPHTPHRVSRSQQQQQQHHQHQHQHHHALIRCSLTKYLLVIFAVLNVFGFYMIYVAEHGQLQTLLLSSTPIWLDHHQSLISHHENTKRNFSGVSEGRLESLRRLQELGIDIHNDLDDETIQQLPEWDNVVSQYGNKAIVLGLETCDHYRRHVAPKLRQRLLAAAGTFNSGTNLLAFTLENNCQLSDGKQLYGGCRHYHRGINWQVPWGKHNPIEARFHNTINKTLYKVIPQQIVLPVVAIRHPFDWLQSMCKQRYTLRYSRQVRGKSCPWIVTNDNTTVPVRIDYGYPGRVQYETVVHLWNRWNRAYYETIQFPRLMVRHEDLVFYPDQVVQQVCHCVGGTYLFQDNHTFQAEMISAKTGKGHGRTRTGFIDAWIKYGKRRLYRNFHPIDQAYARDILDKELLDVFQYEV